MPPHIFASTMMRRTSCGPICGRPTDQQEFVERWGGTARNLAQRGCDEVADDFQPNASGERRRDPSRATGTCMARTFADRFLHARLQGKSLAFSTSILIRRPRNRSRQDRQRRPRMGMTYYDVWTSFSPIRHGERTSKAAMTGGHSKASSRGRTGSQFAVTRFTTEVQPPKEIHARARVEL